MRPSPAKSNDVLSLGDENGVAVWLGTPARVKVFGGYGAKEEAWIVGP